MKKISIALTLLLLGSSSSIAADMAVKARPLPAPVASWTGFYAGVNAGYGWGNASSVNTPIDSASQLFFAFPQAGFGPTDFNTSFRQKGAVAGGQAGYNWQFGTGGVAGIEVDLQYADIHGSGFARSPVFFGVFEATSERRLQWFGTVRGRLGFLATPNLLLYGTGGLAYGQTDTRGDFGTNVSGIPNGNVNIIVQDLGNTLLCSNPGPGKTLCYNGASSDVKVGWTAGVGGEMKITPNWSLKLEYLHVALPGTTATLASPPPSTPGVATAYRFNRQDYDIVRVGLNYHFGAGAVVAKY